MPYMAWAAWSLLDHSSVRFTGLGRGTFIITGLLGPPVFAFDVALAREAAVGAVNLSMLIPRHGSVATGIGNGAARIGAGAARIGAGAARIGAFGAAPGPRDRGLIR